MKYQVTPQQIENELYRIFSEDSRAAQYLTGSHPQYLAVMDAAALHKWNASRGNYKNCAALEWLVTQQDEPAAFQMNAGAYPVIFADYARRICVYGLTEKSQNSKNPHPEVAELNNALQIIEDIRGLRFQTDEGKRVRYHRGAALFHPRRGYVSLPGDDGKPFSPDGGADALRDIMHNQGGLLDYDGIRFVWPCGADIDSTAPAPCALPIDAIP